jgi:hypothetical protein
MVDCWTASLYARCHASKIVYSYDQFRVGARDCVSSVYLVCVLAFRPAEGGDT